MSETHSKKGVSEEAAPVKRSSLRKKVSPKKVEKVVVKSLHDLVKVNNKSSVVVHTPSGSVAAGKTGTMKRLDANRMHAYVEIIDE